MSASKVWKPEPPKAAAPAVAQAKSGSVVEAILNRADAILNPPVKTLPFYTRRFMFLRSVRVSTEAGARLVYSSPTSGVMTLGLFTPANVRIAAIAEDKQRDLHIVTEVKNADRVDWYYIWVDFANLVSLRVERSELTAIDSANMFAVSSLGGENQAVLELARQLQNDDGIISRMLEPVIRKHERSTF